MNIGRTIAQIVAVYIVFAILMGGSEALLLAEYQETMMAMGRPEPMMGLIYGAYLLGTIAMVLLYNKLVASSEVGDGVFYGAMVGLIYVEMILVNYGFLPMPERVMMVNAIFIMIASIVGGIVIAKLQPADSGA